MSAATATTRARRCFALASHPATGEGERSAATNRGLALIEKYGLDPDLFDIPGRECRPRGLRDDVIFAEQAMAEAMKPIFGSCAGCGGVAWCGAMCQACAWAAESLACEHGEHGFCLECDELDQWLEQRA